MTSRANKKKFLKKRAGPAQIVHPWFIILARHHSFVSSVASYYEVPDENFMS